MWGLYLAGELIKKYDEYAEALQDAVFAYDEIGLTHEIKWLG